MLHRLPEAIVPLSIHRDMGWISQWYQPIVALPVKMVVKVEEEYIKDDFQLDAVSY